MIHLLMPSAHGSQSKAIPSAFRAVMPVSGRESPWRTTGDLETGWAGFAGKETLDGRNGLLSPGPLIPMTAVKQTMGSATIAVLRTFPTPTSTLVSVRTVISQSLSAPTQRPDGHSAGMTDSHASVLGQ
jgi:hypothetical protein